MELAQLDIQMQGKKKKKKNSSSNLTLTLHTKINPQKFTNLSVRDEILEFVQENL